MTIRRKFVSETTSIDRSIQVAHAVELTFEFCQGLAHHALSTPKLAAGGGKAALERLDRAANSIFEVKFAIEDLDANRRAWAWPQPECHRDISRARSKGREPETSVRRAGHIDAQAFEASIYENLSPPHLFLQAMSHTRMFQQQYVWLGAWTISSSGSDQDMPPGRLCSHCTSRC